MSPVEANPGDSKESESLYCRSLEWGEFTVSDTARPMRYDAGKGSVAVAYLLWLFLGVFGAHRFYLGCPVTGAVLLTITVVSVLLMFVRYGFLLTIVPGMVTIWISLIWGFVDLFLIPGITRKHNVALATEPSSGESAPGPG